MTGWYMYNWLCELLLLKLWNEMNNKLFIVANSMSKPAPFQINACAKYFKYFDTSIQLDLLTLIFQNKFYFMGKKNQFEMSFRNNKLRNVFNF